MVRTDPKELARQIKYTPWARDEYKLSYEDCDDDMEKARRFVVRLWMGIGGKTSDISGWSNNIKPTWNGKTRFHNLDETIYKTADRLRSESEKMVQIENMDAIKLLERYNRKETLAYIDPPYPLETRSKRLYKHEYKKDDHLDLLEMIKSYKGKVILSSYENDLYDEQLKGWGKYYKVASTEMGRSAVEVVYLNYVPPEEQINFLGVENGYKLQE